MAVFARDERGANWVLNNDADEFWYHPSGTLKGALPSSASVLHMPRRNMLPPAVETGDDPVLAMRLAVIRPQPDRATPATLRTLGTKALCPAAGLREVHSGNHGAAFDTRVQEHVGHGIIGYHYPIRSRTQFTRKVVDGAAALGRNKTQPYETGRHWREWHKLYKAGKLDAEYDRLSVPDTEREALLRDGTIVEDRTISRCHPERNIKSNFAFARKLVGRGGMSWI